MKKKMKKGQAVLSAWTLIAAMGLTPVLSVSYPNGIATVYAKEAVNEAVEEAGTAPMASPSEARREKEKDSAEGEMAQAGITQTDQKADQDAGTSDLEDKTEAKAEKEETEAGTEEIKTKESEAGAAEVIIDKDELIPATPSNATPSNAMFYKGALNIWGGMEMSDHFDGEGTEEEPYEINSDKDLKLLAYHVANEEVDGYEGYYFALTRDISLSDTASWLPIGYFTEAGDSEPKPFKGNFNGQGYRVYNLKISDTTQDYAGLFGSVHGAVIENLTVDGQVNAHSKAALLVGETNDSTISNCSSRGQVRGVGVIGGIVGEAYDSVILECTNTAGVLGGTDADGVNEAYAGGICGSAQSSFMSDCTSDTTDSYSALYSEGYVGGIAGNIYETEIYNTYVEGKVGSTSADYIGGLVGRMQSGQVKNGRFAGTIGASTSSTLKTAGLFVGYIEGGTIDLGDDLAYLYTDSEDKYSLNPFGNKLTPQIRLEHHIGAYYSNQRDFSLYQMGSFIKQTNRYFYEELETGVLEIGKENIHHYAPSKTGDPVRGYLITIPAVDHGTLSVLESQNNFAKEINWANPGAVAKGAKVLVYTSPLNETESEPPVYYELVPDSLSWTTDDFDKEIIHTNGAETSFTMPEGNITLSAKYRAMTNGVILDKTELTFEIEQIRSGSRWNPQIGWKVTDPQKLTATVIPDTAANKNIIWNVKDTDGSSTDVIHVTENGEVSVNQSAKWIQELIQAGVTNQELYPSKKITTEGTNYASVTVTTEAGQKRSSAFVTVNFKITDDTVVPVSDVKLDQSELAFEIVRTLEGDRLDPTERYSVTPSKRLYETITPEYADNKNVKWSVGDADMLRIDSEGIVSAKENAKWILDLIRAEEERNKEHPYAKKEASGTRSNYVTVTTEDGGKQSVCAVNLSFRTDDQTIAHVASVALDKSELKFSIEKVMTGSRANPSVSYQVTDAQQLTAFVMPEEAENKEVSWNSVNEAVVSVSGNGLVTVLPEAAWIKALEKVDADNLARDKYYVSTAAGTMETSIQVLTLDGQKSAECKVIVAFKTTDQTQRPSSGSSGGSSSGGGGGGSSRSVIGSAMSPNSDSAGTWIQDSTGWWYQNKDGSYPAACWQLLTYNGTSEWYHFDEKGYMQTGWFTDTDGNRYYLHAVSDGTRGRMYTGWNLIDGVWYYFNPTSDGTKGSLFMNRQTPDGYRVDASGAWVE